LGFVSAFIYLLLQSTVTCVHKLVATIWYRQYSRRGPLGDLYH